MLLESLESRSLFTVAFPNFPVVPILPNPGEFQVNTTVDTKATDVDTASSNNRRVAVWTQKTAAGDTDIRARRFTAAGSPLGPDFLVAGSSRNESEPAVSMDDRGFFVVVWTDEFKSGDHDIRARRYDFNGNTRGIAVVAGTTTNEYEPDVAVDPSGLNVGSFVVTWTADFTATDQDIRARQFQDNGLGGDRFSVAKSADFDETRSSVARNGNGVFSIAYQVNSNAGDIHLQRFAPNGALLGKTVIAGASSIESSPSVGIDDRGNVVVAWQELTGGGWDVRARKVLFNGIAASAFTVGGTSLNETSPSVAVDRSEGDFFVAYERGSSTQVVDVAATGVVRGTLDLGTGRLRPAISINSADTYFVGYERSILTFVNIGVFGRVSGGEAVASR